MTPAPKKKDIDEISQKEESFYVGISDPLEIRRTILEASKGVIQAMHRYEKYREYRDEKQRQLKCLSKQMSELNGLIATFKQVLPKNTVRIKQATEKLLAQQKETGVSAQEIVNAKIKVAEPQKKAIIVEKAKNELSEIEKLELELSEIESKLSSLNK